MNLSNKAYTLAAGAKQTYPWEGKRLTCVSATAAFEISFGSGNEFVEIAARRRFVIPEGFRQVQLRNPNGVSITFLLYVSDTAEVLDLPGTVEISGDLALDAATIAALIAGMNPVALDAATLAALETIGLDAATIAAIAPPAEFPLPAAQVTTLTPPAEFPLPAAQVTSITPAAVVVTPGVDRITGSATYSAKKSVTVLVVTEPLTVDCGAGAVSLVVGSYSWHGPRVQDTVGDITVNATGGDAIVLTTA